MQLHRLRDLRTVYWLTILQRQQINRTWLTVSRDDLFPYQLTEIPGSGTLT